MTTATIERPEACEVEQQAPEPIRVIKWVGNDYQWVKLASEQIEATRLREQYVAEFGVYA